MSPAQFDIFQSALGFVSIKCGVTIGDLDSSRRDAPSVFARQVLIWLLRYRASMTLQEIGSLLKRRSSTIHYALRALNDRVETDCATARHVSWLIHGFPDHASRITHHAS